MVRFRRNLSAALLVCAVALLFSCASSPSAGKKDEVDTSSRKYTSEDAASYEISRIQKLSDGKLIEAFWRSMLLLDANPHFSSAQSLYASYEPKVVALYKKAVAQKDYLEALRLFNSLDAVGYTELSSLKMQRNDLESAVLRGVPGFSAPQSSFSTLAACVKGTVTVFVDKGVKVQGRVGYNDSVLGSGFFIDRSGYIITNHHVIA
ncbi:MAG: hypothetical protein J6Y13_00300, partial [Treponema sp.]|nr:hypothetical protein [Treponema sp.]